MEASLGGHCNSSGKFRERATRCPRMLAGRQLVPVPIFCDQRGERILSPDT